MQIIKTKIQQQKIIERQHKSPVCAFLKPIKGKNIFCKLQNMQIYCKNFKKYTGNTSLKKLVRISKNIIKEKSKCAKVTATELEPRTT